MDGGNVVAGKVRRAVHQAAGTAVTAIYRTVGNQPASGEKSAFAPNLQLSFS